MSGERERERERERGLYIICAVRVWFTSCSTISLWQLVWADVLLKLFLPIAYGNRLSGTMVLQ